MTFTEPLSRTHVYVPKPLHTSAHSLLTIPIFISEAIVAQNEKLTYPGSQSSKQESNSGLTPISAMNSLQIIGQVFPHLDLYYSPHKGDVWAGSLRAEFSKMCTWFHSSKFSPISFHTLYRCVSFL